MIMGKNTTRHKSQIQLQCEDGFLDTYHPTCRQQRARSDLFTDVTGIEQRHHREHRSTEEGWIQSGRWEEESRGGGREETEWRQRGRLKESEDR